MAESLTVRRKRLRYASHYRGIKESDLIFGRFAERHLDSMGEAELDQYEALLAEGDQDLYAWITGKVPVPHKHDHELFRKIQHFDVAGHAKL
ncbi:MAG: succinate dehydrogenase assembly factor 2 [Geminicoccaceae bacterium]